MTLKRWEFKLESGQQFTLASRAILTGVYGYIDYQVALALLSRGINPDLLVRSTNNNVEDLADRGVRVVFSRLRSVL